MTSQFLTTTSTEGLRPLGSSGQRSFELITQMLSQAGLEEAATLFAEPEQSEYGDGADWYTDLPGRVVPLPGADAELRAAGLARLASLGEAIAERARTLTKARDADQQRLGEALSNALAYPGEDSVFLVVPPEPGAPPQPVIVNWAWERETQGSVANAPLTARVAATPRPARAPRPAVPAPAVAAPVTGTGRIDEEPPPLQRRGAWLPPLLWVLVAVLSGAVLYLLLPACGLTGLGGFANFCPRPALAGNADRIDALDRERAMLENRIARAEREFAGLDRACTAQGATPGAQLEEAQAEPTEIDRRLARENAGAGELKIALAWDTISDVDLHVYCPDGGQVYYGNRTHAGCGAQLDVDANAGGTHVRDPVEHVYFADPPAGTYRVSVNLYADRAGGAVQPFTVILQMGETRQTLNGEVSRSRQNWQHSFEYRPGEAAP